VVDGPDQQRRRGDDAPGMFGNEREQFWKRKAEEDLAEWLEQRAEEIPEISKKSRKKRKAYAKTALDQIDAIAETAHELEPRVDAIKRFVRQISEPQPDYTAIAAAVIEEHRKEQVRRRRKRDLETVLMLVA